MHFFRLLHRRAKSEGDVPTLLSQPCTAGIIAPVFVPPQVSLPSFDPTRELYSPPASESPQVPMDLSGTDKLDERIIQMESQLALLQEERSSLEQDLVDYRTDLLHARTSLYTEMLSSARHQQEAMDDFRTIQKLEARHQRFCNLLVNIGIPRTTVDTICQIIQSRDGSPEDILVGAIKDALDDGNTMLSGLKPVVAEERTPEHYQSALNLTLNIRKELKSQKKRSKFWKKLAQEDHQHVNTITPSPSDVSSIRQDLSPERQNALDALVSRRRAVGYSENQDGDVFGGHRRESALDTLASSLASRPRRSMQDDLKFSSSFSSSASSASSTHASNLSGLSLSQVTRDSTSETPMVPLHLPSPLSTSLRRSSRNSSQSVVLGSINLNVSRSYSIDLVLPEEQPMNADTGPTSTVTFSQDLLQNVKRISQGHGHRRISSTALRRSLPTHSTRSSFRLSTLSPVRSSRHTGPVTVPEGDLGNTTIEAPSFHTPNTMMRLSDLVASTTTSMSDTPALSEVTSEDTPFSNARVLPKYGTDTPLSPMELEPRIASTPSDVLVACKPLGGNSCAHDSRFLEHLDCSMSMTISESESAGDDAHHGPGHDSDPEPDAPHMESGTGIPIDDSKDSLFTTSSASSLSADDTPAPSTPPTPSPSPASGATSPSSTGTGKASIGRSMLPILVKHLRRLSLSGASPDRERLVGKLRGLRSLSRSQSGSGCSGSPPPPVGAGMWHGSPGVRSESSQNENTTPSPSPVKGSGIPVLQRRMTIRARRMSARKI